MNGKSYVDLRIEQLKLKGSDSASKVLAAVLAWILIIAVALLLLTVLAFAGILLLGKVLDNYALGAFIVCGALLLVLLVLLLCRKKMFRDELAHNLSGKKDYKDLVRSEELVEARLEDNSTDYLGWSSVGLRAVRILLRVLARR
ncbi:MAG: hypothetical protein J6X57_08720 [Bacteroidales bacterium]|nr:hypothetical protein [Bacteroidales bacterium]